MEIDQLRPATTEEQMEMMLMNMDIKLPDFYRPNCLDVVSSHNDELTTVTNTISADPTQFLESPPAFVSLANSRISFSGCDSGGDNNNSPNIQNPQPRWRGSSTTGGGELSDIDHSHKKNSMAVMREMIFRIAAMQPIHIDPESVKPPKRRNVKISKDPQSVAARHRRERISERIRILQRLVPGGTKMDTASMLDEAIHYVKFLKNQLQSLESVSANNHNLPITSTDTLTAGIGFPVAMSSGSSMNPLGNNKPFLHHHHHHHYQPPSSDQPRQGLQHYGAA